MKHTSAFLAVLGSVLALQSATATPTKDPRPFLVAIEKRGQVKTCGGKKYDGFEIAYSALPKYAAAIKKELAADPKIGAMKAKVKKAIATADIADRIDGFLKSPSVNASAVSITISKSTMIQKGELLGVYYGVRFNVLAKDKTPADDWFERAYQPDECGGKVTLTIGRQGDDAGAFRGADGYITAIDKMTDAELVEAIRTELDRIYKKSPDYRISGVEFDCAGFAVPASSMNDMRPDACIGLSKDTAIVSGTDKDRGLVIRAISVANGSIVGELNGKAVQNRTDLAKYATRNGCGMGLLTSRIVEPNHALLIYTSLTVIDWKFGANPSLAVLASDYNPSVAYACIGNPTGIDAGAKDISLDAAARTITVSGPRGSKTVNY